MKEQDRQAALDALAFVCRTLGWLEVVPPYGDAVSRTKECDTAIKQCETIRAALTAKQEPVKLDASIDVSSADKLCMAIKQGDVLVNIFYDCDAKKIISSLTSQQTKTDDNVSCPNIANTVDINAELLEALRSLLSAFDNEGLNADYHAYVYQAEQAIARAEAQKMGE